MFKTFILQPLVNRNVLLRTHQPFWWRNFTMTEQAQVGSVEHDVDQHEFLMVLQNGEKALLQYEVLNDGVMNLYHTEVPVSCRGQGLAQVLAKAAFDHVVATDAKMILTCSYLVKYLKDNPLPQYTSRVQSVDTV